MGQVIHARMIAGKLRYRMWSTVVGDYVSYEEDEDGIRRFARDEAVSSALDQHEITWPERLKRAKETGSSSRIGHRGPSVLDDEWEKPLYQKPEDECGNISFAIGQPTPVEVGVVQAVEAEQTARARTRSLEAEGERADAEAKARQVLIDQVGPEVFACLRAIDAAEKAGVGPPPCIAGGATPVVPVG